MNPFAITIRTISLALLRGDSQADERSPVLSDDCDVAQIKAFEPGRHPFDVPQNGVILNPRGFVGAPEADEVARKYAVSGLGQGRDHCPVQVAPGGLAVE